MITHKTHLELITIKDVKFILNKNAIISITTSDTPDWAKDDVKTGKVTVVVLDEKDDDGKPTRMVVKNSYSSLKKLLA